MAPRHFSSSSVLVRRRLTWVAALAVVALEVAAQTSLPKDSPFLPPNSPSAAAANDETLEFAGVSTVGKKTDLIIFDKAAKKNRWIPLGDTVAGITAVKYDPKAEMAVIRASGVEKNLPLRKGSGPINAPVPVNVPPPVAIRTAPAPTGGQPVALQAAPAVPATPETIAKQEVEARMLVSDLLEIGMAQRKAYEEAHRKAAEASAGGTAAQPANTGAPGSLPAAPDTPAPAPVPTPAPN